MLEVLTRITTLLKSFSSSAVTFATADNSIAATGIGTAFPTAGTKIVITGASEAANNTTFTIVSATANKIIVSETVTAESPGAAVVCNEEAQGDWKQAFPYRDIVGAVSASQNCTVLIDFGNGQGTGIDYTVTLAVTAGVPEAIEEKVLSHYVRLRVRNGGTDQTTMRAYINGLS